MASGSFSTSVAGGHYTLRADWSGTGAASNNTTPVNVKLYLVNDWRLDIGSRSGTITINGTSTSITSSAISTKGTHLLGQATTNVVHNADGSKSITIAVSWAMNATISGYGYIGTISTNKTVTLDKIPRYATSVQSLKSKTATSITMNWSSDSTIDYVWYSKNGGSSWTAVGSVNAKSGSYTISGLTGGTDYSIKTRVRRKDSQLTTDSSALSVTTYSIPTCTISLNSKTETSMSIKWTSGNTINKVEYSTNNGSSYTTYTSSISAKTGSVSITGLTQNTDYNIKIRVTDSNGTIGASSTLAVTTYQYPYVSAVGIENLTIGNNQTLTLYNPLGRSVTVYMRQNNVSGTIFDSETTSDTSVVLKPTASDLYASIPNSKSGTAYYYVEYSGNRPNPKTGTYIVPASSAPTVSTLTYEDTNTAVQNVIQNNQLIVQNKSQVKFTCTGLTAKNSASIASAKVVVNNQTINLTISGSSASGGYAVISVASATTATLTVTDSRGLTATKTVKINMLAWSSPTGLITMQRQDNYYSLTYITVDAIYSSLDGKNSVTIEYTAKATGQTDITGTLQDNVQGSFTADNTLDWTVSITITDALNGKTTYYRTLPIGTPIIFFDSKKKSVGINTFPESSNILDVNGDLHLKAGKAIYNDGSENKYAIIQMIDNTSDIYGNGIAIGGGGQTIIGGGESAYTAKDQAGTAGAETMWICNDGSIDFYPNMQHGWSSAKHIYLDTNGDIRGIRYGYMNYLNATGSASKHSRTSYTWNGLAAFSNDSFLRTLSMEDARTAMGITAGTWTPTFVGTSGSSYISKTAGSATGWYIKIGLYVILGFSLHNCSFKNSNSARQYLGIKGLPYAPNKSYLHYGGGGHAQGFTMNGADYSFTGWVLDTSNSIIYGRAWSNAQKPGNDYIGIPANTTATGCYASGTLFYIATS